MNERGEVTRRKCVAGKDCSMTMGYYIGGGQYICWAHALKIKGMIQAVRGQEQVSLNGDSQ